MENSIALPVYWDEKYIICSLYYLIAASDYIIKKEEVAVIDQKMEHLLLHSYQLSLDKKESIMAEALSFINKANDQQKMEAIRLFSSKVVLPEELYVEMLHSMEAIALADGNISIEEHSLMYYVKLKFKKSATTRLVYS